MISEALAAAAVGSLANDARDVLARLGGPVGEAARDAARTLATLADRDRRTKRAEWAAIARAPLPPGLRGVDPSWIERALEDRPARTRELVAGAPIVSDVDVWLVRAALATIPPMPVADPAIARPRSIVDATRMSVANLRAWLEDVGADQLAFALGERARGAFGDRIVVAAERIAKPPRLNQLGARRAAIERAKVELDERALVRIGARTIAPHVDALARRQLVHRLSIDVGQIISAELAAFASASIDQTATWAALAVA